MITVKQQILLEEKETKTIFTYKCEMQFFCLLTIKQQTLWEKKRRNQYRINK